MIQLLLIIIITGINVLQKQMMGGKPGEVFDLSAELLKIVQLGVKAHELQTGKPLDPALIKPIEPIP